MEKTLMILRILIKLFLVFSHCHIAAQDLYTTELNWFYLDSECKVRLEKKEAVVEWCKQQSFFNGENISSELEWDFESSGDGNNHIITHSRELRINTIEYWSIITVGCSGIPCQNIFVFQKINSSWCLIASSNARIIEELKILQKDNDIVFIKGNLQIGILALP